MTTKPDILKAKIRAAADRHRAGIDISKPDIIRNQIGDTLWAETRWEWYFDHQPEFIEVIW